MRHAAFWRAPLERDAIMSSSATPTPQCVLIGKGVPVACHSTSSLAQPCSDSVTCRLGLVQILGPPPRRSKVHPLGEARVQDRNHNAMGFLLCFGRNRWDHASREGPLPEHLMTSAATYRRSLPSIRVPELAGHFSCRASPGRQLHVIGRFHF